MVSVFGEFIKAWSVLLVCGTWQHQAFSSPFIYRHHLCAASWRAIIGDIVHNKCFGLLLVEVICSFIPPSVCAQPTPLVDRESSSS